MNKEMIISRQNLRIELLTELYKHYYNPNHKSKERYLRLESKIKEDSEKELAYAYLLNKGFIKNRGANDKLALIITTDGIDFLENYLIKK